MMTNFEKWICGDYDVFSSGWRLSFCWRWKRIPITYEDRKHLTTHSTSWNIKNAVYKLQPKCYMYFPNKIRIMASKKIEFSWQLLLDIFWQWLLFPLVTLFHQQWFHQLFSSGTKCSPQLD
jgi:hypothetical protein